MKYTLSHLIQNLQHLQQDLPIVLSQSENPTIFQHDDHGTCICLKIEPDTESNEITVGELCFRAKDFAKTNLKNEVSFKDRRIHIFRKENTRVTNFVIKSLELVGDYVYLVLDEA